MDPRYNRSGIEPWSPPENFENPVPDDDYAGAKSFFVLVVLALLIGGGVYVYDKAPDWYDDARDKIEREIDKIQFPGEDATDQAQQKSDNAPRSPDELEADGKSSLPGDMASTTYEASDQTYEYAKRQDIDNPYDGSAWVLTRMTDSGSSSIQLGYFTFIPPIADASAREAYWDSTEESLQNQFGDPQLKVEDVRVDAVNGRVWRFENPQRSGEQRLFAWFIGPEHSYSYMCTTAPGDPAGVKQCERSLDDLKLKS